MISLRDKKGNPIILANGLEARSFMSVDAILSIENGADVKAGDVLARIPRESSKTRDITGGLPRVAELFEARKPKDACEIAKIDGVVDFAAATADAANPLAFRPDYNITDKLHPNDAGYQAMAAAVDLRFFTGARR